jgi:hypothetical protein
MTKPTPTISLESKIREIIRKESFQEIGIKKIVKLFEAELKEERKTVIFEWEQAIFYSELGKGKLSEKIMKNHLKLAISELKGEGKE